MVDHVLAQQIQSLAVALQRGALLRIGRLHAGVDGAAIEDHLRQRGADGEGEIVEVEQVARRVERGVLQAQREVGVELRPRRHRGDARVGEHLDHVEFGRDNVGMITGDTHINTKAPVICCTAEILANDALREGEDAGGVNVLKLVIGFLIPQFIAILVAASLPRPAGWARIPIIPVFFVIYSLETSNNSGA